MPNKIELHYIKGELSYAYVPIQLAESLSLSKEYFGPTNIYWEKLVTYSSPLEYLSKSEQKKITKAKEYALNNLGFSLELNEYLTAEDFNQWIEIYIKNIDKKELGYAWIGSDWYEKLKAKSKLRYGSIMIKDKEGKVIGGALIKKVVSENSISCDFRAHEYIKIKDSSLSALIEYALDEYALKFCYNRITRGSDENLYGIRLSKGLHEFKKHYRFTPKPLDKHGNNYPRILVFFKEFQDILTYNYSNEVLLFTYINRTNTTTLDNLQSNN